MSPDFVEYNTILTLEPKSRVINCRCVYDICSGKDMSWWFGNLFYDRENDVTVIDKRVIVWSIEQWTPENTTRDAWKFFQIALA